MLDSNPGHHLSNDLTLKTAICIFPILFENARIFQICDKRPKKYGHLHTENPNNHPPDKKLKKIWPPNKKHHQNWKRTKHMAMEQKIQQPPDNRPKNIVV